MVMKKDQFLRLEAAYVNRIHREFLHAISSETARSSNINCDVTVDVKHDKSEPVIDIIFDDGERLVMKGSHLTSREMLSFFNSRCIAKTKKLEDSTKK
uniref:Large ribosomal subunit protein mL53 n=1 Tax=Geotrypetes seraphini TaxID=260995 RepID=A0A6P8PTP2_GEOSA|nr:39S ribosomal protein L53, mitochondrial isoform X2 [Geotrypetes seraphini]